MCKNTKAKNKDGPTDKQIECNTPFPSYGGHLVCGDKNRLFEMTSPTFSTKKV